MGIVAGPSPLFEVLPLVVDFLLPASVHGFGNNFPVGSRDCANEEHLDIVFDRNKLGVVDPGLLRELLALYGNFHLSWSESKLWLATQKPSLLALFINDAVLFGFDTFLFAPFAAICENRPRLLEPASCR